MARQDTMTAADAAEPTAGGTARRLAHRLRGLGEFFGTRQHGLGDLEIGDLLRDRALLDAARADALELVAGDPGLKKPEHALLRLP